MKIEVTTSRPPLSDAALGGVERCVLLALSRFGPRLLGVSVALAEPANAMGGVDQRCQMRARFQATDDVQAEAINGTIAIATARAAAQLARRVSRILDGHGRQGGRAAAETPGAATSGRAGAEAVLRGRGRSRPRTRRQKPI